jgi:FkbM family methyltransferase
VSNNNQPTYFSNLNDGDPLNTIVEQSQHAIEVPSITLDQFMIEQAFDKKQNFLLKIDVEGFEHEVLLGAKHFLANFDVKAIILETFSSKHEEIQSWLEELGFKMKMVSKHNMLAYR